MNIQNNGSIVLKNVETTYPKLVNPNLRENGSAEFIVEGFVGGARAVELKAILDQKMDNAVLERKAENPYVNYRKSLFYPVEPVSTCSKSWKITAKSFCSVSEVLNGKRRIYPEVPIFTLRSSKDTRADREGREILCGSKLNLVVFPSVYEKNGIICGKLTLIAAQIVREGAANKPLFDEEPETAEDFGFDVIGGEDNETEAVAELEMAL